MITMDSFKPNSNFFFYLYFIQERMNIFWNKLEGNQPYTEDEILKNNKFTNVYRVLDRSSQYLVKNIINNSKTYSKEDLFWRILLYKHFNLPDTWEALIGEFGDITLDISNSELIRFLKEYQVNNNVYSNAYMLTAAFMRSEETKKKFGLVTGMPKFELYLRIFEQELFEKNKIQLILDSKSFKESFDVMLTICSVADFLAYQYIQDFNYSSLFNFDENSFCAAGPGTERGILRTFDITGKPDYQEIVKWVQKNYEQLVEDYSKRFDFDLKANLLERKMKVPDFSNCFCESDKMMRGLGIIIQGIPEGRIKQTFKESQSKIEYVFPNKWGVKSLK